MNVEDKLTLEYFHRCAYGDVIAEIADPKRNDLSWEDWGRWVQDRAADVLERWPMNAGRVKS